MRQRISAALKARLRRLARARCGYCLTSETLTGMRLEVEHIWPLATGGTNDESNLWLACRRCNSFKGSQTQALDAATNRTVRLYQPHSQTWTEHFGWDVTSTQVIGLTPTGRATVAALKLNSDEIVAARRRWVSVGWWPPVD